MMQCIKHTVTISLILLGVAVCRTSFAAPAKSTSTSTADADWDTGGDWDNGAPDESKDDITIDHDASSGSGLTFSSGS